MPKKKLQHLAELETFTNVLRPPIDIKGKWHSVYFRNNNPIILELACGKGEYTLELARRYPECNFVGVDKKGPRLWRGAKTALDEKISNVAFLTLLIETIDEVFDRDEVSEIWITFPDPYPKRRHEKHRLTSPQYFELYKKVLKHAGSIHLKTDDANLFEYTVMQLSHQHAEIIRLIEDVHAEVSGDDVLSIRTTYEKKYLKAGRTIKYLCFQFKLT